MATEGASRFPHGLRKDLLVLLRHIDTQLLHCKPCHNVKPERLPLSTERMCNLGKSMLPAGFIQVQLDHAQHSECSSMHCYMHAVY